MFQPTPTSATLPHPNRHAATFQALLPQIALHARAAFRSVKCPDHRADLVAEVIALVWQGLHRLADPGQEAHPSPQALALQAIQAVQAGVRATGQEPPDDVLSPLAQRRHGFTVRSLPATATVVRADHATAPRPWSQ